MGRIDEIVRQVDSDEVGLEQALQLFEEGVGHVQRAKRILDRAEQRIKVLTEADDQENEPVEPDPNEIPF